MRHTRHVAAVAVWATVLVQTPYVSAAPDLRSMLSRAGLTWALEQWLPALADQTPLDDFSVDLFRCPIVGGAARASVSSIRSAWRMEAVNASTSPGKLTLTAYVDLTGSAELRLLNLLCQGSGEVGCVPRFEVHDVPVRVDVLPTVEAGQVRLSQANVTIDIGAQHFSLDLSSCGVAGEVVELAYRLIGENLIGLIRPRLERLAREQLVTRVERLLQDLGPVDGEASQLRFAAQLIAVPVDGEGIGADAKVDTSPVGHPSCAISAKPPAPATSLTEPRLEFEGEHLGLALSRAWLQNAVVSAWEGGLFCWSGAETPLSLGGGDEIQVTLPQAPEVSLERADAARLRLRIPALELALGETSAQLDLIVSLALRVDTSSAVLLSEPTVEVTSLRVSAAKAGTLELEPLIRTVLPELIAERLHDLVLLPRVFPPSGDGLRDTYLYVTRAETTPEHVLLYAKLARMPEHDDRPPQTELIEAPSGWGPAKVQLRALGADDQTPVPLLRYSWRVDTNPWTEPELAAGHEFSLSDGAHQIEVAAVDLNGNRDATPATVAFQVDAVAPKLAITRRPPDKLSARTFTVEFSLSDNHTPQDEIVVHVRYERSTEESDTEESDTEERDTEERDTKAKKLAALEDKLVGETSVELFPLGIGAHTLTLVAEDAVGNRSLPAMAVFEAVDVESNGGTEPGSQANPKGGCCAIHSASNDGSLYVLFALIGWLGRRWVRRQRVRDAVRHALS